MAKSPDDIKHGLIVFAGGQEVLHLKQDVLIDNLIEEEIQRRLADERKRRKTNEADSRSDGHSTDLIPGVYEGNQNKSGFERHRSRALHAFERNHQHRNRHANSYHHHHRSGHHRSTDSSSSNRRHRDSRHEMQTVSRRHDVFPLGKVQAKTVPRPRRNELRHPWFNQDMATLIGLREKAHRKWAANKHRQKGDANWEAFKRCRSAVSALRRVRRNEYLVAALHVDTFASAQPWQTKGISASTLCPLGIVALNCMHQTVHKYSAHISYSTDVVC